LDDQETRKNKGLIEFERLRDLWQNPPYQDENGDPEPGYPESLHPIFLRLMERFDLSYRIKLNGELTETSLLAQLVPDNRPETLPKWETEPDPADKQQIQICRIVEETGQQANAEGLFYQLIVRLHQYSLGRENYPESIHWQRGLMLGDRYNGRALLEHIGTDIKITVRAAYPERFLSRLTEEVESLFDPKNPARFWKGLRCQIMVPCISPCPNPGQSLFNVEKLIEHKFKGRPEFPCSRSDCDQWQNIDQLLKPHSNPELAAASVLGLDALESFLRLTAESYITLNEAKLILVGEGEVGKSCLLGALREDEWIADRPTTHGIEIKPCQVTYNQIEITLNGWDFGGQTVYRPTHQLFFSTPAVYLVVWKPREGSSQGFVDYWITLINRRAPQAKIIVVATHGGPNQRQPDIERQSLINKLAKIP